MLRRLFHRVPSAVEVDEIVRQLAPWRDAHRRWAWKPVVTQSDSHVLASKFSGTPWLDMNEPWPTCGYCGEPMQLFVQLNLQNLPDDIGHEIGCGLLQLFYCVNDRDGKHEGYSPFSKDKLVRIVDPGKREPSVRPMPGDAAFPARTITSWNAIEDYPGFDETASLGLRFDYQRSNMLYTLKCESLGIMMPDQRLEILEKVGPTQQGDKLLGWPDWVQGPEYPNCPQCGTPMKYLFQIASEDNIPFMFGDSGVGHITQCPVHRAVLAFAWACC